MGFLEFPFHLFSLGEVNIDPLISSDVTMLIMTDVTREQNRNRGAILAFEFNFIINHSPISFNHLLEPTPLIGMQVQILRNVYLKELFFAAVTQHVEKSLVDVQELSFPC